MGAYILVTIKDGFVSLSHGGSSVKDVDYILYREILDFIQTVRQKPITEEAQA